MTSTDPFRNDEARQALLAQVAHLVDEMNAFTRHFGVIPTAVLEGRPVASAPSFKEIYGLLSTYDDEVYRPALEAAARGQAPDLSIPSDETLLERCAWNERSMDQIVDRVKDARSRLVAALKALSDWSAALTVDGEATDVFGMAYGIVRHDAALLRAAAHRLHESRLTSREDDLPK